MSTIYITNGITQDGFGARMHRAINTLAFSLYLRDIFKLDIQYIHTPFYYEGFGEDYNTHQETRKNACNYQHGDPYNEIYRDGYIKRAYLWDKSVNFTGKTVMDIDLSSLEVVNIEHVGLQKLFIDINNDSAYNKLYIIKYLQHEFNSGLFDINIVDTYYSEIRNAYNISTTDNDNILFHIRRKDAIFHGDSRYIDDNYYLEILEKLQVCDNPYSVTIHTQRSNFNYEKFNSCNIVFDDQEEDYIAFNEMVNAKVLVVSKSSLSIAAAFLNKNIIVYPQQITKGLSRYINKEEFIKILTDGKKF